MSCAENFVEKKGTFLQPTHIRTRHAALPTATEVFFTTIVCVGGWGWGWGTFVLLDLDPELCSMLLFVLLSQCCKCLNES